MFRLLSSDWQAGGQPRCGIFTRPQPKNCHSEPLISLISGLNTPPPVTTVTAFLPLKKAESAVVNVSITAWQCGVFFGLVCVQAAGKREPSIIKYGTLGTADLLLIQVVEGRPGVMSLNRVIKSWTSPLAFPYRWQGSGVNNPPPLPSTLRMYST